MAAGGTDLPDEDDLLDALDENVTDQGSGSRKVDTNLQIMTTNLKLLRDELKAFREELQSISHELSAVKWRNRVLALFSAIVLTVGIVGGLLITNTEHSLKKTVDRRGAVNAQRSCDTYGSQLVIYNLLLHSPGLNHVAIVEVGQAVDTAHKLRAQLSCPPYTYLDPTTNQKISVQ